MTMGLPRPAAASPRLATWSPRGGNDGSGAAPEGSEPAFGRAAGTGVVGGVAAVWGSPVAVATVPDGATFGAELEAPRSRASVIRSARLFHTSRSAVPVAAICAVTPGA